VHNRFLSIAAAGLIAAASPAFAQSQTSERKAEQPATPTSGTIHDHIERAERVVKELLAARPANATDERESRSSSESKSSNTMVAVERTQLQRLATELNEIDTAANDTSAKGANALDGHINTASALATTLANQPATSAEPGSKVEIVTVDRTTLKQLRDEVESIERLAKNQHHDAK
jgi:hypothetical protein